MYKQVNIEFEDGQQLSAEEMKTIASGPRLGGKTIFTAPTERDGTAMTKLRMNVNSKTHNGRRFRLRAAPQVVIDVGIAWPVAWIK